MPESLLLLIADARIPSRTHRRGNPFPRDFCRPICENQSVAGTSLNGGRQEQRDRGAFTLIEVLVVVAMIALLLAILLPSLQGARQQARTLACASNLRQLMIGAAFYWTENQSNSPGPNTSGVSLHRGG